MDATPDLEVKGDRLAPVSERELDANGGRDHNGQGFSIRLAGGGIKGGMIPRLATWWEGWGPDASSEISTGG